MMWLYRIKLGRTWPTEPQRPDPRRAGRPKLGREWSPGVGFGSNSNKVRVWSGMAGLYRIKLGPNFPIRPEGGRRYSAAHAAGRSGRTGGGAAERRSNLEQKPSLGQKGRTLPGQTHTKLREHRRAHHQRDPDSARPRPLLREERLHAEHHRAHATREGGVAVRLGCSRRTALRAARRAHAHH